jgi:hypothetical protein
MFSAVTSTSTVSTASSSASMMSFSLMRAQKSRSPLLVPLFPEGSMSIDIASIAAGLAPAAASRPETLTPV